MSDRYVHAIWCDDIRQEVGNKISFMGVYTGGIALISLPFTIPRLTVYICISTPLTEPLKKLTFRVVRDDGFPLAEVHQELQEDMGSNLDPHRNLTRMEIMAAIFLNNIEIPEVCKYFKVLVDADSETLEGPKLHIYTEPSLFTPTNLPQQTTMDS